MPLLSMLCCGLALLAVAGCQGDGGAVTVRWRIVDQSTGSSFDPGDVKAANGACACACIDATCVTHGSTHGRCVSSWRIDSVSVELANAVSGAPVITNPPSFACSDRERTTAFELPPGTFAISLAAHSDSSDGLATPTRIALPPPSVRTIVKGEVVNLDVIAIGVDPLPLPR
jgi:hypothetical protein